VRLGVIDKTPAGGQPVRYSGQLAL
jgi:hypothetical protein